MKSTDAPHDRDGGGPPPLGGRAGWVIVIVCAALLAAYLASNARTLGRLFGR